MRRAVVCSVASGLAYAATFPPWSLSLLAWVALVPWLVACARTTAPRAAMLGVLFGIVASYGVGWWFPEMLTEYFELPAALGWPGFLGAAVLGGGIYFAAVGAWIAWASRRGAIGPLAIAAVWMTGELVRARLMANPWGLSPYSQARHVTLVQIADLGGPFVVSMILGWSNGLVAGLVDRRLRGHVFVTSAIGFGVVLAASLAYGVHCLGVDYGDGDDLTVAIVQGDMERGHSWHPEYWPRGLDRYLELTERVLPARPDLIVWPENAINFYLQEPSPEQDRLFAAIRRYRADVLLGGPRYAFGTDSTHYYNSAFLFRETVLVGTYDKQRLLPVAEIPALGLGDRRMRYTAGSSAAPLASRYGPLGVFICVEGVYPEHVMKLARGGAQLLVEVSNDAWFRHDAPARHHLEMTALRAVENRRWLVRAASTGISAVIDAHGRIRSTVPLNEQGTLVERVPRGSTTTLYQRIGDGPAFAVAGVLAMATILGSMRREPEASRAHDANAPAPRRVA